VKNYARFLIEADAQAYADHVQAELSKNAAYIASKWSDVVTGSDGAFYVAIHQAFPHNGQAVDGIPSALDEITDGY
jgi:hypothetical protein